MTGPVWRTVYCYPCDTLIDLGDDENDVDGMARHAEDCPAMTGQLGDRWADW